LTSIAEAKALKKVPLFRNGCIWQDYEKKSSWF